MARLLRPKAHARQATRCPFCHDGIDTCERWECRACGSAHHEECVVTHGSCAVDGCGATESVPFARFAPRPDRVRLWGHRLAFAVGYVALALASLAAIPLSAWHVPRIFEDATIVLGALWVALALWTAWIGRRSAAPYIALLAVAGFALGGAARVQEAERARQFHELCQAHERVRAALGAARPRDPAGCPCGRIRWGW